MSEQDFVMAWLLAARAGSDTTVWSEARERSLLAQAQRMYKLMQWELNRETRNQHCNTGANNETHS